MNIYLGSNGRTTGPYTEEQIHRMLADGSADLNTLGWREGETDWKPLSQMNLASGSAVAAIPPPLPGTRGSPFALILLIFGITSAIAWVIIFGVAGYAKLHNTATESFNTVLGLFVIAGLLLNLLATVFSIIVAFTTTKKGVAVAAAALNAVMLAGVVLLMLIGISLNRAR